MKKLAIALACLTALPVLACAQSTDAQFADALAAGRENILEQRKPARSFFRKFFPGSTKLKMKKNLIVETNLGFAVSRMLVSSEFEWGSETLARQEREAAQGFGRGSRYIGFALKVQDIGSGRAGFKAGRYENKSKGYMYPKLNPIPMGRKTYGGPGIAAFEFLGMGPNVAFLQDNGTREFPVDPQDPKKGLVEKRIAPTFYDEGVRESLVVEAAYDELQQLISGRVKTVMGNVRYYIRGGFHREVYDLRPIAPVTARLVHWPLSLKFASEYWKHYDSNKRDPETLRELDRLGKLRDLLARIEEKESAGKVLIRLDQSRSDDSSNVLVLEFQ